MSYSNPPLASVSPGWVPELPAPLKRAYLGEIVIAINSIFERRSQTGLAASRLQICAREAGRAVAFAALSRPVHRIGVYQRGSGEHEGISVAAASPPVSSRSRPVDDLTLALFLLAGEAGERRILGPGAAPGPVAGDTTLAKIICGIAAVKMGGDPNRVWRDHRSIADELLNENRYIHDDIAATLYFISDISEQKLQMLLAGVVPGILVIEPGPRQARKRIYPDPFDFDPAW